MKRKILFYNIVSTVSGSIGIVLLCIFLIQALFVVIKPNEDTFDKPLFFILMTSFALIFIFMITIRKEKKLQREWNKQEMKRY